MRKRPGPFPAKRDTVLQVQRAGPFRGFGRKRSLSLRPEQIQPVVRIAHKLPGGLVIPERIIFDHELVLILEGKGGWTLGGEQRTYAKHDLLFIPPFTPHGFQGDPHLPSEHIAVHFDFAPDVPRAAAGLDRRTPYAVRFTRGLSIVTQRRWFAGHRGERALREVVAAHAGDGPLGAAMAAAHLNQVLLGLLGEIPGHRPAAQGLRDETRVRAVVEHMRAQVHTAIKHAALEKVSGLSTSRLQALFREVTGYPPLDYLRRLRVEEARRLLADHRLSVKEIAARTGFRDTSHFSKVFRRIDGLSPAHYREALLAGRQEK